MAKTFNYIYEQKEQLCKFVVEHELHNYPNLLVQVFSDIMDKNFHIALQNELHSALPNATIIGCTTDGEIADGKLMEKQTLISFTQFDHTHVHSTLISSEDCPDSTEMGRKIVNQICNKDTKVLILLPTSFNVNVNEMLEAVRALSPEIAVIGGVAGDQGQLIETFIWNSTHLISSGVVAVALNNSDLLIQTYFNKTWRKIGQTFQITEFTGNKIVTINHKKPSQILNQYLGEDIIKQVTYGPVDFPFLINRNGEDIFLFVQKIHNNGTLEMSETVQEGDLISFAYTNIPKMIESSLSNMKKLYHNPVETIFFYNCTSRKRSTRDFVEEEIYKLNQLAPVSGFFSYGEFCIEKGKNARVHGNSTAIIGISESKHAPLEKSISFKYDMPKEMKSLVNLTRLIEASSKEIIDLNAHLTISEQYYKSLFDNNTDFVYSTDLEGNFTSVNQAFIKTFGYTENEILGKSALKYIKETDIPRVSMHFYRALKGKEQFYNVEIFTKSGDNHFFHIKNIPIIVNGEYVGVYGIGKSITEQRKIEEKMMQLAYFDNQTGLPNRLKFTEILEEFVERSKKKKRKLAVMFIDIDRFKIINDSLGHYAGDDILKELCERIKTTTSSGSYLGRFSGDKFTLLLTKNVEPETVLQTAKLIMENMTEAIRYGGKEFFISASIGICFYPDDGLNAQMILKNADIAMNRSKQLGGKRITFFLDEMNKENAYRLEIENNLRKGLNKNEFYLCYQPLIDLNTGQIYGSEALLRWNNPSLGQISPVEFIPIAEEIGVIEEIGNWVMQTACIQNKKWHDLGYEDLVMSVNVSAYQFQQSHFLDKVKGALENSGMPSHFLQLELTESLMLRNVNYSINLMKELQDMGVKVSIDDFGTGYSSLSYLKNLPIDTLKIDRSFINNLKVNTSDIAIVNAIITMGHGLEVKVVAEGVETEEQMNLLKEMNCHYAQGFYIHKPLSVEDFEKDLKNKKIISIS